MMKQLELINTLRQILPLVKGLDAAILYGSFARKEQNPNSDIDIQILVNDHFNTEELKGVIHENFDPDLRGILEIKMRNKLVAYFRDTPKMEFAFCRDLSEVNRNYLGSEIEDIKSSILFEREPPLLNLEKHLQKITDENRYTNKDENALNDLLDKFLYEFENCSTFHRRSDGYKFYFFYNIALHCLVQINHMLFEDHRYNFLPKYFIPSLDSEDTRKQFYGLNGTLFLPEANARKRNLLNWLYAVLEKHSSERLGDVREFCEEVYKRDYFWNFRDTSKHNPKIKPGILFRSATLSILQNEPDFRGLINEHNINTVIDLRADREINQLPYNSQHLESINYVWSPLDPWNQPEWFKESYHFGTNDEIAYRFFALGCRDEIKRVFQAILNEEKGASVIHCFAGKDRTGILVSLVHLLSRADMAFLYTDYFASEVDIKKERLDIVLEIIEAGGGIENYLISCGLTSTEINTLKAKLFYE